MANPMPKANRQRIHDRVLGMRFMPGTKYNTEQIALACHDLWPGVTAAQMKGVVAGLASKEKAIRAALAVREAQRTRRIESG